MTEQPCYLYRHFDAASALLYVGISINAVYRLSQHKTHSPWFGLIRNITVEEFPSRADALAAEARAIAEERPQFNVMMVPKVREETAFEKAERARNELIHRVVNVRPVYKFADAAKLLNISTGSLKKMVDEGRINTFKLNDKDRRQFITGWQIIDFLEYLEKQEAKVKRRA